MSKAPTRKAAQSTTSGTASKTQSKRHHIQIAAAGVQLMVTPVEARVDSRLIAEQLGNRHKSVMVLIDRYADEFRRFGHLAFEMSIGERQQGGGRAERLALLNEDQALFLLALSRNTLRVVQLKARLITAFGKARRAAQDRSVNYLPAYHDLHDVIAAKAAGSVNERWVHANVNKLVNRTCGLQSGQRLAATMGGDTLLTVAHAVAAQAMRAGRDHHDGYARAKAAQDAADRVKAAWQSVGDSLVDEVKRIRGEIAGSGAMGLAQAQAQFAIATGQARAGDQDAATSLPELSRTVLELAGQNASSAADLKVFQAQIAASLVETTKSLAASQGITVPGSAAGAPVVSAGGGAMQVAYAPPPQIYTAVEPDGRTHELLAQLVEENRQQAGEIARLNLRMAKLLEKWDVDGMPLEREEV